MGNRDRLPPAHPLSGSSPQPPGALDDAQPSEPHLPEQEDPNSDHCLFAREGHHPGSGMLTHPLEIHC